MNGKVLLVDDDPLMLRGCQVAIASRWTTHTAKSGVDALLALTRDGPYDVIVSDLHMPEMSGLELLIETHRIAPDTVRLMLTGVSDSSASIDAINAGRVFRFLKKPCPSSVLVDAVQEAMDEHARLVHEHSALDETCAGAVRLLTHLLSEIDPPAVTTGQRLAEQVRELGTRLNVVVTREIEAAALLLRVGLVGLPQTVNAKLRAKKPLTSAENEQMKRLPELGSRLLGFIPRLTAITEIVRYQVKGFDGTGQPNDGVVGEMIPLGARLLLPLVDLFALESGGLSTTQAVHKLQHNPSRYDPGVFAALADLAEEWTVRGKPRLEARLISELREGMELTRDVATEDGFRIAAAGTRLTEAAIERLHNFAEQGRIRDTIFVVINDPSTATPETVPV